MADYHYPEYVACQKCGLNAKIQASPSSGGVKSPNPGWRYQCPAGAPTVCLRKLTLGSPNSRSQPLRSRMGEDEPA
jgi:hypothetical protein